MMACSSAEFRIDERTFRTEILHYHFKINKYNKAQREDEYLMTGLSLLIMGRTVGICANAS